MKEILFATAYAPHSKAAYRYAQKLAQHFEANITLVHIFESPSPLYASSSTLLDEIESQSLQRFTENQWKEEVVKIKAFADEMNAKQFHDITLDFIVTDGDVVSELLAIQQKNQFDLLVMGMQRHSIKGRLFGNTANQMIDKMTCPILLIPIEASYMGIDKIVYGTAFEIGDIKSIEQLLDWSLTFGADIHLLHVHQKKNTQQAEDKMNQLMQHFQEENKVGVITSQLIEGKIAAAMEEYIQLTGADILAVHRRKQGFWQRIKEGSLTKILTEEVMVPLLVLKSI